MDNTIPMVSYWQETEEIHVDDDKEGGGKFVLIIGRYNHQNGEGGGRKALGVHWHNYPKSHGRLTPCAVSENARNALLDGLLHQAVSANDTAKIKSIIKAIDFFRTPDKSPA
jgi:hypothetical protein